MINSLPQSLIDTATQHITEALAAPAHKALATKAANKTRDNTGLTAAERISQHVIPLGEDRTVIPLERTFTPDKQVTNHLAKHGFQVHDYEQGLVTKPDAPDRKLRIGRVLHQTDAPEHIKKAYEKDPARQGIKGDPAYVVISRRPSDVAAMSTHQNWQSCQTLGGKATITNKDGDKEDRRQEKGCYSEMVPGIVSSGAHIAYLVKHPSDVDKHYGPIARTTLNPFTDPVSKHTILRPSESYGDDWEGFHHTVKKWAEQNIPATKAEYHRHKDVYQEGDQRIANYGPEHDEHWKKTHSSDAMREHPSQDVITHYVNNTITGNISHAILPLMQNKHISEESSGRLVNHFSKDPRNHNALAVNAKNPDQINRIMDKSLGDHIIAAKLANNQNANHNQLHTLMDTYGAVQTNVPGERKVSHNGYSPTVINNIVNHNNSNDSHFHKVLALGGLQEGGNAYDGGIHDHWSALESMARRYHGEDVGRKIVGAFKGQLGMVPHNIVYDVAEKHPHLLRDISDNDVAEGLQRHPMSKPLMDMCLERNTKLPLKAVAFATKDHDLLTKLSQHPDTDVAEHAKRFKSSLERMEKYAADEKAFNQGNGQ